MLQAVEHSEIANHQPFDIIHDLDMPCCSYYYFYMMNGGVWSSSPFLPHSSATASVTHGLSIGSCRLSVELLPTPAKSHYAFNLRDLSKQFQGMLMVTPGSCPDKAALVRLWQHEASRVFNDRLVCEEDRETFQSMLVSCTVCC